MEELLLEPVFRTEPLPSERLPHDDRADDPPIEPEALGIDGRPYVGPSGTPND
ncbi:hypothetical protein [Limnochorda pilosa]|uniref:hypothetical protein n=1 Tax=Limnochorda pilosa TaxID=1555112 RepID=UPI001E5A2424|nr:hypothetical protein [Limnochorda pilosa]